MNKKLRIITNFMNSLTNFSECAKMINQDKFENPLSGVKYIHTYQTQSGKKVLFIQLDGATVTCESDPKLFRIEVGRGNGYTFAEYSMDSDGAIEADTTKGMTHDLVRLSYMIYHASLNHIRDARDKVEWGIREAIKKARRY